jgi:hypothetical protein
VNNSAADEIPQTNLENELLEFKPGERVDNATRITSITANQDLEAMEKLDRAKD